MRLPDQPRLQRLEFLAAVILTLALAGFHLAVLWNAGPLWRDEISSLTLATKPTWSGVWATLAYDPFPALFFTILRGWHAIFGGSDFALRVLGCVIGWLGLAGFWFGARLTNRKTPLLALALFCLCPTLIIWGDSLRAYGLAVIGIPIVFAAFWRVINQPRPREIALATVVAILSVQSIFTNAPILFACGSAAAIVAARRRQWSRALIPLAIGAGAALTLVPYLGVIQSTRDWAEIRKFPLPLAAYLEVLNEAVSKGGFAAGLGWKVCAVAAIALALFMQLRRGAKSSLRDSTFYALLAGSLGTVASLTFFRALSWPTNIWYYLPMLALGAAAIDLACDLGRAGTLLRLGAASALLALSFSPLLGQVQTRASNLDLVADGLGKNAAPEDLIVIYPFTDAITFQRYYHGKANWLTIPKMSDLSLHRWDQVVEQARQPNAIEPVLEEVNRTLRSGHRLWLVSAEPLVAPPGNPRPVIPLSPSHQRRIDYFLVGWRDLFAANARGHGEHMFEVKIPCPQEVSVYENSRVFAVAGWKDSAEPAR